MKVWSLDQTLTTGLVLKDEIETSMRLLGTTNLDQATSNLVNTREIDHLVTNVGEDVLVQPSRSKL